MKLRKLSAILLAGALMASPAVMPAAMAETSQTESTQSIVDESGNLVIKGTSVTGVTEQGKNAKEIKIPEGVTRIEYGAIENFTNLESIDIPASVAYIGDNATTLPIFRGCTNLKKINVSEDNKTFFTEDDVLYKTEIFDYFDDNIISLIWCPDGKSGTFSIPEGVTRIGANAFEDCVNLKSINIPDGLWGISPYIPFSRCTSLESVNVSENNENFSSLDGVLFDKEKTELIVYPENKPEKTYSVPESVGYVSDLNGKNLESITIGASTNIGDGMNGSPIRSCKNLKNIYVSEKNEIICSVDGVVYSKDKTELKLYPTGRTDETFSIPAGVETINCGAIMNDYLKSIIIPASVKTISNSGYLNIFFCDNLTDIYYAGSEEQWNKIEGIKDCEFPENAVIHYNYVAPSESTDETTGIEASAEKGVIEDGAKLTVTVVSNKTNATKSTFEISFVKGEKEVEPTGVVTVKLPVPETMKDKTIYVYRVEADGKYTDMNAKVENGLVIFETDHFSEYVLTTEKQGVEPEESKPSDSSDSETSSDTETSSDSETSSDNSSADSTDSETSTDSNSSGSTTTPDTGVAGLSLTLGVIALAGAAVVISRKKR